jgi:hypothetical protein
MCRDMCGMAPFRQGNFHFARFFTANLNWNIVGDLLGSLLAAKLPPLVIAATTILGEENLGQRTCKLGAGPTMEALLCATVLFKNT